MSANKKRRKVLSHPKKAWLWRCECGQANFAPSLQTPENHVICECGKMTAWGDIPKDRQF